MKAVILVGGKATRLLPLTCNIPKAMVPVLNVPLLEYVIHNLSRHRIKDIVIAQNRSSQLIESYFGDGSHLGIRLYYSVEEMPLGTGGAIKNAESYLDETFLVLNGDIFTDLDATAMMGFHRERNAKVTIALTPVADPTSYGLVETDSEGRIIHFLEKPSASQVTTNMVNAGTYILEPEILAQIPDGVNSSVEHELFPMMVSKGGLIYAYPSNCYWIDIGTTGKYLQLQRDLLAGRSSQYQTAGGEVLVGEESSIHPSAKLEGRVLIGSKCTIGRDVRICGPVVIGPGCTIQEGAFVGESVIWRDVQLGERVSLSNSIIADNCLLSTDCVVEDSVLSEGVTVVCGCRVKPGSRIWPGLKIDEQ